MWGAEQVTDALLTSLLAPRPSTTTIQHYARALKQALSCEAVRLFRVDADTQEVFSLLPPAPGSDGQADHYSLSGTQRFSLCDGCCAL